MRGIFAFFKGIRRKILILKGPKLQVIAKLRPLKCKYTRNEGLLDNQCYFHLFCTFHSQTKSRNFLQSPSNRWAFIIHGVHGRLTGSHTSLKRFDGNLLPQNQKNQKEGGNHRRKLHFEASRLIIFWYYYYFLNFKHLQRWSTNCCQIFWYQY